LRSGFASGEVALLAAVAGGSGNLPNIVIPLSAVSVAGWLQSQPSDIDDRKNGTTELENGTEELD
jgi:hypothetical protein